MFNFNLHIYRNLSHTLDLLQKSNKKGAPKSITSRFREGAMTKFEFTVVQKFNLPAGRQVIAPSRNRDVIPARPFRRGFRGSFFARPDEHPFGRVTFLEKQKSKRQHTERFSEIQNLSLIIQ